MKRHPKKGYTRRRQSPARRARRAIARDRRARRFTSDLLLQSSAPAYYRPCCATCGSRLKVLLATDGRSFFCARTFLRGPYGQRMLIGRHDEVEIVPDERGVMKTTVRPLMGIV